MEFNSTVGVSPTAENRQEAGNLSFVKEKALSSGQKREMDIEQRGEKMYEKCKGRRRRELISGMIAGAADLAISQQEGRSGDRKEGPGAGDPGGVTDGRVRSLVVDIAVVVV